MKLKIFIKKYDESYLSDISSDGSESNNNNNNKNHTEYVHKKFGKRKRESVEETSPSPVISVNSTDINNFEKIFEEILNDDEEEIVYPVTKKIKIDPINRIVLSSPPSVKNLDQLSNIYRYHTNMIRKHPPKNRNREEQKRRDNNTIACWISRRKKKLTDLKIEEEYQANLNKYEKILGHTIRTICYAKHLLKEVQNRSGNKST